MMRAAIRRPADLFAASLFSVETQRLPGDERLLHPLEHTLIAHAWPKRRADFAAGRQCAHRALRRYDVAPAPLLRDAHGAPIWPPGTLGSISHTDGLAIGVVALKGPVTAIGVDVERIDVDAAAVDAVLSQTCDEAERRAALALPESRRAGHVAAVFSVKETIYKCVCAATGERLGYADASVTLDFPQGLFHAVMRRAVGASRRTRLTGRVGCDEHHVYSGLYWLDPLRLGDGTKDES